MDLFSHEKRVLEDLKSKGFVPKVIYDVGASNGVWSDCIATVLPESEFHLFEPLSEVVDFYRRDLRERLGRRRRFHLHAVALGEANETTQMFVAQDGFGSSLHDRGEIPEVKARVLVPKYRLDTYAAEHSLPPADVIKIDSQGYEAAILNGAGRLLENTSILMLETWLKRGYGPHTPLLSEVIELLQPQGFSLVRFGECFYDERHRLYSIDAVFCSERFLATYSLSPET